MTATASSWVLLGLASVGAMLATTAVVPGRHLGWGNLLYFACAWLTSELAMFHLAASALIALAFVASGALDGWPGRVALLVMVPSWGLLILAQQRARPTAAILERALTHALGAGYQLGIPESCRTAGDEPLERMALLVPFRLRRGPVERIRDLRYGELHSRQVLDLYRPSGGVRAAPVLLQIPGGGWSVSDKDHQALPLIYHLVSRGWIVVAVNYRLSPEARFPDHLLDCKQALAWTRRHVAQYGGSPAFIAATGGSAGAHLATLLALTANDPGLQPGFAQLDTTLAACVPLYGVYDFPDRLALRGDGGRMREWLARTVMPGSPTSCPELWDLASPLVRVRADAPPFFVLHGTHDSMALVEEARAFVAALRAVSRAPVAYAELPGAQHAWEVFHTVRAAHTVTAIARFLEWAHARTGSRPRSAAQPGSGPAS